MADRERPGAGHRANPLCMSTESQPKPWKRKTPAKGPHTKLTPESKAEAKAAAKAAGRPYPNLVDNMNAARKQREREEESKS